MASTARAENIRVATFNVELMRDGPGIMLRDIQSGKDAQANAVVAVIAEVSPDILLLTGFDYDRGETALAALVGRLSDQGATYPHVFARRPNTGMMTAFDLDGDGAFRGPGDAQGFGHYSGEGGMAILSRLPLEADGARDFSDYLWRDLPGNLLAEAGYSAEAVDELRLSTTAHWDVPVTMPDGTTLHVLAYSAAPPVFDGPEDRNGRRNHDETAFWTLYLDGVLPWPAPKAPVVILGDGNLDSEDGDGRRDAITALLSDARLQDPAPVSDGGRAGAEQGGPNATQKGDPARDTADWPEDTGPGNLRVDYVLPSAGLRVIGSGVYWPTPGTPAANVAMAASRHRLVWVDIEMP